MRIRSIKPEFWSDKRVATWDHFTRLFFVGLWSAADDHGRGSAEPARLAAELFPYDLSRDPRETLATVSRALATLSRESRITLYEVSGEQFFEVAHWSRHQKVDRPGKSRIPTPCDILARPSRDTRETLATGTGNREQGTGNREQVSSAPACAESGGLALGVSTKPRQKREPRPWTPEATALAEACGVTPSLMTAGAVRTLHIALSEIRRVAPDVSPERIRAAAASYRRAWPQAACTPSALAKHWGQFGAATEDADAEVMHRAKEAGL